MAQPCLNTAAEYGNVVEKNKLPFFQGASDALHAV